MAAAKKLKNNGEKDTSILPVDVLEIILSNLPIKSLVRFRTVSRSWQAIISDPLFCHKIICMQQSESFLIREPTPRFPFGDFRFYLVKLVNQEFGIKSLLEFPFEAATPLCSCNGVVLLRTSVNHVRNVYMLWNPSIRKYAKIPCHYNWVKDSPLDFGLYHDSRDDDYKVVIVSRYLYSVFSCNSGRWGKKKCFAYSEVNAGKGVFVDGCFYWRICRESYKGGLLCFDVRDRKMNELNVQQPDELKADNDERDEVRLIRLTGRLCIYRNTRDWRKLQLWVLEKHGDQSYSWRELMNMEELEEYSLILFEPICLTKEDNVVIEILPKSRFIVYNHREKRFEKSWTFSVTFLGEVLPCPESLFFPNMRPKR